MKKTVVSLKTFFPLAFHALRWHIKYHLTGRGFPMACGVFLTNRCNLHCRMCSIWTDKKKQTLTPDQVRQLVDAVTPGLCYLSFSGGEPLLVDGLTDMVAHASRRVPHVHLVTNGLLLDDILARELARAGLSEISISLDGEREWHNRLRNSEQGYDAALRAIEAVKRSAPDMRIVVNTVIFPDRLDQVRKAAAITEKLGVLHKVQPVNRHFLFQGSVAEPEPIRFAAADIPAVERLTAELSKNRRIVNSRFYLKQIPSYFSRNLICPMIRPRCLLPHFFLEASSYGRVSPCMIATGWEGVLDIRETLGADLAGRAYGERKKALETCRKCDEAMYICYWEPLIQFPLSRFIRYGLF